MTENQYDPPLAGVRVIDLSTGPMLAIGRLYADLGADITRVDLAGVTTAVPFGPVVDGVEIAAALATLGIPSTRVDPATPQGSAAWRTLLEGADILIETTTPGSPEEEALDVAALRRARPALVVLSVSDFGRDTRFARWKGTSPVFHALSSELSRTGAPGREPLVPPGELPYDTAAAQAAFVALTVFLDRLRTGRGDVIDFSVLEGAAAALDPAFGMAGSAAMGESLASLPRGRTDESHKYPIIPCLDGHVRICVLAKRQWQGMFEWMGRPERFADPSFDNLFVRFASPDLIPAIAAFFADRTRAELEASGQRYGVPTAAVLSVEEAVGTEQVAARGFFRDLELAPGLTAPVPVGIAEVDGVRASVLNVPPPPRPARPATAARLAARPRAERGLPLEGIRVVDFGVIIVGGDSTRMLADLGAEVVKVENSAFPDGARASLPPGVMMPGFASGHRNKRSIGIDLQHPEGLELARRLIAEADLVFTNWKPGTMEKLGLDHASLASVNPGVVVIDSSAFGPTGPWAQRLGYGPLVRAATGFTKKWVYPDAPDGFQDDITVYPDHVSSRIGALLALALLVRRERTGRGGSGSSAQAEIMMSHMVPDLVVSALAARGHAVETPAHDAPWGVFPAAGDDDWLVVTVRGDDEWRALTTAIGRPDLRDDDALRTRAGRDAARQRIDEAVGAWAAAHTADEGMELLQAARVPAGAMLRGADLPRWELSLARRTFREETHPFGTQPFTLENVQIHAEHVADPPSGPAPLLGEHTAQIAAEALGLSADETSALVERGILEAPLLPSQV
ncbi:CaiB/BaiF CoA-transferase family protein [Microbacterium sp. No. 7]|uniref:CaiB/BaiF CoA-transferase family protein n=1 Tax=Microbacterium sp. No. 7 TaxID=1714373 RepID=UPI0006D0036A|nr:CoA transferase [Microbacterium sp. No. 7]ALJ21727.1 CoA-transferase [Microbacterium sp. No. 7]